MQYTIDRIEEGIAVCERSDGMRLHVLFSALPDGTREGSILTFDNGHWTLLADETARVRQELFDLQESLFDE